MRNKALGAHKECELIKKKFLLSAKCKSQDEYELTEMKENSTFWKRKKAAVCCSKKEDLVKEGWHCVEEKDGVQNHC
jgi:hypothetical protein